MKWRRSDAGRAPSWSTVLSSAALLLISSTVLEAQQEKLEELIQQGAALVKEGKFTKATETLEKANELADGESIPVLVGLAMAYNGNQEPDKAIPVARQAVERAQNDQFYWLALGELTLALAMSSEQVSAELESAFDAIRGLLAEVPSGSLPNRLRQRLCWARGFLPADSSEGLARTEKHYSRQEVHVDAPGLAPPRQIHAEPIAVSRDDQRRLGESEEAVLRAVVDLDGCVLGGEIIENSNDYWMEIAFGAMRRCVFEPARMGDEPVKAFITLRFDYPSPFRKRQSEETD